MKEKERINILFRFLNQGEQGETQEEIGLTIEEEAKVVDEKQEEHSHALPTNFDDELRFTKEWLAKPKNEKDCTKI